MIGLFAYLACVVAVAALACGHQGEAWPLRGAWRVLAPSRGVTAVLSLVQHSSGGEVAREAPEPSSARAVRPAPAWARTDTEDAA